MSRSADTCGTAASKKSQMPPFEKRTRMAREKIATASYNNYVGFKHVHVRQEKIRGKEKIIIISLHLDINFLLILTKIKKSV